MVSNELICTIMKIFGFSYLGSVIKKSNLLKFLLLSLVNLINYINIFKIIQTIFYGSIFAQYSLGVWGFAGKSFSDSVPEYGKITAEFSILFDLLFSSPPSK